MHHGKALLLLVHFLSVLILAGCGQKGDLFIPPPQPEVPVTQEQEKEGQS